MKQARTWYHKALELARAGDHGAIAALVALRLGLRASEIISRLVADLDEDQEAADLLWDPVCEDGRRPPHARGARRAAPTARGARRRQGA